MGVNSSCQGGKLPFLRREALYICVHIRLKLTAFQSYTFDALPPYYARQKCGIAFSLSWLKQIGG